MVVRPQYAFSTARAQIDEQIASNRSAVPHFESFGGHRQRLTAVAAAGRQNPSDQRLCVLGAGNSYDLDLARLTYLYREVHLVDIDPAALERAYEAQSSAVRQRIVRHAPVDLSGFLDKIDRWNRLDVTPSELMAHPEQACRTIAERLPGPFDVVLSACLLSQMHLAVLNVLSSTHRLFEPVRQILNITHLRTLVRLSSPAGGRAILATDLSSNLIYPLETIDPAGDLPSLMNEMIAEGKVIQAVHPGLLAWTMREDPELRWHGPLSPPLDVWLWNNGPERIFLVYAVDLGRA